MSNIKNMSNIKSISIINKNDNKNEDMNKTCNICGIDKRLNDFYSNDRKCKPCKILYNKERRRIKNEKLNLYKNRIEDMYDIKDKLIEIYENKIKQLESNIKYMNRKNNIINN